MKEMKMENISVSWQILGNQKMFFEMKFNSVQISYIGLGHLIIIKFGMTHHKQNKHLIIV